MEREKKAKCNVSSLTFFSCLCGVLVVLSLKMAASLPYKYLCVIGSDEY